jgi:uncharacterized protein
MMLTVNRTVSSTSDAGAVLAGAGGFLATDPLAHNLTLTLLTERATCGDPGRYWTVSDVDVVGVALQSPTTMPLVVTPFPHHAIRALADALVAAGVELPGVTGEAGTAAAFAGRWSEQAGVGATPESGMRLHQAGHARGPHGVPGWLRPAALTDRDLLIDWVSAFSTDIGEPTDRADALVDRRLPAGCFWIWDHDGPASIAALTPAVAGAVRVQAVYTPPGHRGHGYAGATVAALTQAVLDDGHRPLLYTDLDNPLTNRIYRRIGYHAVSEHLRYRFSPPT